MNPEEKFKQWALDPNGGGWKEIPTTPELLWLRWEVEQRAFLAGMEADRWISVEERLPEEREPSSKHLSVNVHIWIYNSLGEGYYDYRQNNWVIVSDDYWMHEPVTHWQPLPKKPI